MDRRPLLHPFSLGGWLLAFALLTFRGPQNEIADHYPSCDPMLSPQANTPSQTLSLSPQPPKENLLNNGTSLSDKTASTEPPLEKPSLDRPNNHESSHSSVDWHAERLLEQIEELVDLEEPIKQAVKGAIVNQQRERYSSSLRFDHNLLAALGSQASDLEQQITAQNIRRQEKERAREVAALSHQLNLSKDQSDQVGLVLKRLQTALAPARAATEKLLDEGMQKHLEPETKKSQLRESMAIIEQSQQALRASRQQFLAAELRSILSIEQYQAWLNETSDDE